MKLLRFFCIGILFILVFVVGGRFYAMFSHGENIQQNGSSHD